MESQHQKYFFKCCCNNIQEEELKTTEVAQQRYKVSPTMSSKEQSFSKRNCSLLKNEGSYTPSIAMHDKIANERLTEPVKPMQRFGSPKLTAGNTIVSEFKMQHNYDKMQNKILDKKEKATSNPMLLNNSITSSLHISEHSSKMVIYGLEPISIDKEPYLIIEVIEGCYMINKKFKITKTGLEGSLRKANDGVTYFGQCPNIDYGFNDYNFHPDEKGFGQRHMMIRYFDKRYYIKDLADGTGTFIKLVNPIQLIGTYIVSFGETYIAINLDRECNKIVIKVLEGIRARETFLFTTEQLEIIVGRDEDCHIRLGASSVSRKQCSIVKKDKKFYLHDGYKQSHSTNGTWLFAEGEVELFDTSVFKAGESIFKVNVFYNNL